MAGFVCLVMRHRWFSHWSYADGRHFICQRCGAVKR